VLAYEEWMDTQAAARLEEIAAYNEEDCRATLALRDWLVEHRPDDAAWAESPDARPVDDDKQEASAQREALRQALLAGVSAGSSCWLAAELLEYHCREARPAWWWFFARCQMSLDELVEDSEAIGRLEPEGAARRAARSLDHRFRFPAQQHKLAPGDMPVDPRTGKERRHDRGAGRGGWRARPPTRCELRVGAAPDGVDPAGTIQDECAA
jgi:hypothetical protein